MARQHQPTVAPYSRHITDITVTGNTASATVEEASLGDSSVMDSKTAQFTKQGGVWQISVLP
jgi:hypothetical protein